MSLLQILREKTYTARDLSHPKVEGIASDKYREVRELLMKEAEKGKDYYIYRLWTVNDLSTEAERDFYSAVARELKIMFERTGVRVNILDVSTRKTMKFSWS